MISNKYPDKMAVILKKENVTIKAENQGNVGIDTDIYYINEALCKVSKSFFFDYKISYCSNGDVNKISKKK